MQSKAVSDGWRALIGRYTLPVFSTMTRDGQWHPEAAIKAQRVALNYLNVELHGKHYRRKGIAGVQGVMAVERHKDWRPHTHGLWGHADLDLGAADYAPLLRDVRRYCDDQWGFSRWEPCAAECEARNYVIDYAAKTGELYVSEKLETLHHGQLPLTH